MWTLLVCSLLLFFPEQYPGSAREYFRSDKTVYHVGDTLLVTVVVDTFFQVGSCQQAHGTTLFYQLQKQDSAWLTVFNNEHICNALYPTATPVWKGFEMKHLLTDLGTFRFIAGNAVSNPFRVIPKR